MQLALQAEQQGHDDGAAAGQQATLGDGQAAEHKGQEQGDLAGHAMIAAAGIDQIAGNHQ